MSLNRVEIKNKAKVALNENYWPLVGYVAIAIGVSIVANILNSLFIGYIVSLLVVPVITLGISYNFYKAYNNEDHSVSNILDGFQNFGHVLGGYWWMFLFTFLWSLLFVIPGIIKGISYSMTSYILLDQPEVGAQDALKLSMAMTKGHKMEIFIMYLSFIGWGILSAITCGIVGIFYAGPYFQLTCAGYYKELKAEYERNTNSYQEF